jgi:SAM-dependent methyltransferase
MAPEPSLTVDFGKAAGDYALHRQGFPPELFRRLEAMGVEFHGRRALDLGTGTGLFARDMAQRGALVTGLDPSQELLSEALSANGGEANPVEYIHGFAEKTGLPSGSFDIVAAATCWHWFDREKVADEARRLLKPGGQLLICHLDWWKGTSGIVTMTGDLINRFNTKPANVTTANTFQYPMCLADLRRADFHHVEVHGFTTSLRYSHAGWIGRVLASANVGPAMSRTTLDAFEQALAETLQAAYPMSMLEVEHLIFALVARQGAGR